jgi:hypothetical protein
LLRTLLHLFLGHKSSVVLQFSHTFPRMWLIGTSFMRRLRKRSCFRVAARSRQARRVSPRSRAIFRRTSSGWKPSSRARPRGNLGQARLRQASALGRDTPRAPLAMSPQVGASELHRRLSQPVRHPDWNGPVASF